MKLPDKYENKLPAVAQDIKKENILATIDEEIHNIKITDTYPTNMECKKVQRVIMYTAFQKLSDAPNGMKNKYISFLARGYPLVFYDHRNVVDGQHFPLMFPISAVQKMFSEINPWKPLKKYAEDEAILEMHFRKINHKSYEILMLASVKEEPVGTFTRTQVHYKLKKYRPEAKR